MNYVVSAFNENLILLTASLQKFLVFCLLLISGWLISLLLKRITRRIFEKIELEEWSERLGVEHFLLKGGVRFTSTTIIVQAVYWISITFTVLVSLHYLGIPIGEDLLHKTAILIPRLIGAFVILIFGLGMSRIIHTALLAYLNNLDISGAVTISKAAQVTVIILTVVLAIETLNIGGSTLITVFLMAFGALCLAVGISFGLAGRKFAKEILEKAFKR